MAMIAVLYVTPSGDTKLKVADDATDAVLFTAPDSLRTNGGTPFAGGFGVAVSPTSRYVLALDRVYDSADWSHTAGFGTSAARRFAWAPDETLVGISGGNLQRLDVSGAVVSSVATSATGGCLFVTADNQHAAFLSGFAGALLFVDIATGAVVPGYLTPEVTVTAAGWAPQLSADGSTLYAAWWDLGASDMRAAVYDMATHTRTAFGALAGLADEYQPVTPSEDGTSASFVRTLFADPSAMGATVNAALADVSAYPFAGRVYLQNALVVPTADRLYYVAGIYDRGPLLALDTVGTPVDLAWLGLTVVPGVPSSSDAVIALAVAADVPPPPVVNPFWTGFQQAAEVL